MNPLGKDLNGYPVEQDVKDRGYGNGQDNRDTACDL